MSIKLYVSFGSGFYCQMNEFKPCSQPLLELPNPTQRSYLGQQTALSNLCAPALSWTICQALWMISSLCRKDHAHPGRFTNSTDAFWPCSPSDRQTPTLGGSIFTHQGLSNTPMTVIKLCGLGLQQFTCRNMEVLDFSPSVHLAACFLTGWFLPYLALIFGHSWRLSARVGHKSAEMAKKLVSLFFFFGDMCLFHISWDSRSHSKCNF